MELEHISSFHIVRSNTMYDKSISEVTTNTHDNFSLGKRLIELAEESNKLVFAVAFFNDKNLIKSWLNSGKKITLIVSLTPPTDYYSIKDILHKENLKILYYDAGFHSKIYSFYKDGNLHTAIIGSSNFTQGGFESNIETNVLIKDFKTLSSIERQLKYIETNASILQPDVLEKYKKDFDKFKKRNKGKKSLNNVQDKKQKISKEAMQYYDFWKVVDHIKLLVQDIAQEEYPNVPAYLTIDHFWHWIVKICNHDRLKNFKLDEERREKEIPILFKEYCDWDKKTECYTNGMPAKSEKIQRLLFPKSISTLTKSQAKEVYEIFHATQSLIQRFKEDRKFLAENDIVSIRKTFMYLLHSTDEISTRIHNSISTKSQYKLRWFGPSCVQELIGWYNPEIMPIRNSKANDAIKLLGYRA